MRIRLDYRGLIRPISERYINQPTIDSNLQYCGTLRNLQPGWQNPY